MSASTSLFTSGLSPSVEKTSLASQKGSKHWQQPDPPVDLCRELAS